MSNSKQAFVVSKNFKILGIVAATYSLGSGEFIFDCNDADSNKGVMTEIISANKLKVSNKLSKNDMRSKLKELLVAKYTKKAVSKDDALAGIRKIVKAGKHENKDDDTILIEIVNSGVSYKNALSMFKKALEAEGFVLSTKKRKEVILEVLDEIGFAPETFNDVVKAVGAIKKKLPIITDGAAMSGIRSYAKANKITMPKKQKMTGGRQGAVFNWIKENPDADEAAFTAWLNERFTGGKTNFFKDKMTSIFTLVNDVHEIRLGS